MTGGYLLDRPASSDVRLLEEVGPCVMLTALKSGTATARPVAMLSGTGLLAHADYVTAMLTWIDFGDFNYDDLTRAHAGLRIS